MKTTRKNYEAPRVETITIENSGVLCSSAPIPTPSGNSLSGGNQSMNMSDVNWP